MIEITKNTFYILILVINSGTLLYLIKGVDDDKIGVGWTLAASFTGMLVIFLLSELLV